MMEKQRYGLTLRVHCVHASIMFDAKVDVVRERIAMMIIIYARRRC